MIFSWFYFECPIVLYVNVILHHTDLCVYRKSTSKVILPCEFEGCDKIFSSRQYLNVSAESVLTVHDTFISLYWNKTTLRRKNSICHYSALILNKLYLKQNYFNCNFVEKHQHCDRIAKHLTICSSPQHHVKYQHLQQKTFTCSYPPCSKSFNFKKHLKEHEKLHSSEYSVHMNDSFM